jgi:hypothetical protein
MGDKNVPRKKNGTVLPMVRTSYRSAVKIIQEVPQFVLPDITEWDK